MKMDLVRAAFVARERRKTIQEDWQTVPASPKSGWRRSVVQVVDLTAARTVVGAVAVRRSKARSSVRLEPRASGNLLAWC